MSYDIRSYDDDAGDPVVVMVVKGPHDVSRIVQALTHGNCEQADQGFRLIARLKRHNKGRMALALLKAHGGADFTDPDDDELVAGIRRCQGIPEPPAAPDLMPTRWRKIGAPGCDVVTGWASRCGEPTVKRDETGWRYCQGHEHLADELSAEKRPVQPTTMPLKETT